MLWHLTIAFLALILRRHIWMLIRKIADLPLLFAWITMFISSWVVSLVVRQYVPPIFKDKDLSRHVSVVVGGATGIGMQLVKKLYERGAKVIVVDRNRTATNLMIKNLRTSKTADQHGTLVVVYCDLADFRSIRKAAKTVERHTKTINSLYLNAAMPSRKTRLLTLNGIESLSQINCFGHLAFFEELKTILMAGRAMIVATSSMAHASVLWPRLDDLEYLKPELLKDYSGWHAYSHSKLILTLNMKKLAELYWLSGLAFMVVDPKVVITELGDSFITHMFDGINCRAWTALCRFVTRLVGRTAEQAAEGIVACGYDEQVRAFSCELFSDYQPGHRHFAWFNTKVIDQVYERSQQILKKHGFLQRGRSSNSVINKN